MKTPYKNRKLVINISGSIFETYEKTLLKFPETLLGNEKTRRLYYCERTNEYFFNRSRLSFEAILFFYQSNGNLLCPPNVRLKQFIEDCVFFKLPEEIINGMKKKDIGGIFMQEPEKDIFLKSSPTNCWSTMRNEVWLIMEYPSTSLAALCFSLLSFVMILVSLAATCMETVPQLQVDTDNVMDDPWFVIELLVSSWFLFELIARFLCTPNTVTFFQRSLNWVDIIAIIPYFTVFAIDYQNVRSFPFLRVVRLWRVLRLFRISSHSKRMRAVNVIMKQSVKDLEFFVVCLTIIIVFGASVMYFIENQEEGTGYVSIPESMWWTVQTLLTVGYGDITPFTTLGKLFSCVVMLTGAVIMSLPVLAIIISFSAHLYRMKQEEQERKEEKRIKKEAKLMQKQMKEIM